MNQIYITVHEAAEKLGVTGGRIRQLISQGRIPGAIKRGNAWFMPRKIKVLMDPADVNRPHKIRMTIAS